MYKKSPENFSLAGSSSNTPFQVFLSVTKNGTYVEKYTAGHLCTKFEEFILIYEAMIAKSRLDLLLAVN